MHADLPEDRSLPLVIFRLPLRDSEYLLLQRKCRLIYIQFANAIDLVHVILPLLLPIHRNTEKPKHLFTPFHALATIHSTPSTIPFR